MRNPAGKAVELRAVPLPVNEGQLSFRRKRGDKSELDIFDRLKDFPVIKKNVLFLKGEGDKI